MTERTATIILRFQDEASAGASAAASNVSNAFKGMGVNVESTTKQSKGFVGDMVQSFKDNLTNAAEHAKWASYMFGTQLLNAMGEVVTMVSKFERFGIAAEFMTGSAREADKFAASVRNISKETMFNVDQIAELEARMVGITGKVDMSDRALRAFADAVAATGGSYSQLEGATRAWTQTLSKSKASSEELNRQFANANIPVLRKLAEAVYNDADHPLRKYIETASTTGGANKTLTASFQTASEKLPVLEKTLKAAEEGLKEYEGQSKKSAEQQLRHEIAVENARLAVDKARGTIAKYGEAQAQTNTVVKQFTVDEILAQFQRVGDLNIPGQIMADAVVDALEKAYGGANVELIKTFDGQMSLLQDTLKLTALSFMGLDASFRPVEGGLFSLLKNALTPLVDWLNKNQEAIQKFGAEIGKSIPALLAIVGVIVGTLWGALAGLLPLLLTTASSFGAIGAVIGLIANNFIDFSGKTERQKQLEKELKDATDQLNPSLDQTRGVSRDTTEQIKLLNEQLAIEKQKAENVIDPINLFRGQLQGLWDQIVAVLQILIPFNIAWGDFKIQMSDIIQFIAFPIFLLTGLVHVLAELALQWQEVTLQQKAFGASLIGDTASASFYNAQIDTIKDKLYEMDVKMQETKDNFFNMGTSISTTAADMQLKTANSLGGMTSYLTQQSIQTRGQLEGDWISIANTTSTESARACTVSSTNFNNAWTNAKTYTTGLKTDVSTNYQSTANNVDTYAQFANKTTYENFEKAKTSATTQSRDMMINFKNNVDWSKPQVESSMSSVMQSIDSSMGAQANKSKEHGKDIIQKFIDGLIEKAKSFGGMASKLLSGAGFGDLQVAEHGGIVAGPIGEPVPIIAHGGERVVPRSGVDTNGGGTGVVNLNFYGGVMLDSDERIDELAEKVNQVLGRQNELARYGVGV